MAQGRLTINPDVLAWARQQSGLDVEAAAKCIDVTPERLAAFESGAQSLTAGQMRKAGTAYRVSPAVFFLGSVPTDRFVAPGDFRRVDGERVRGEFSPELRKEVDRVRAQQRVLSELSVGDESSALPSIANLSPEDAASALRHWLGPVVPVGSDEKPTLNRYIQAIERRGVFVSHVSGISVAEMRGFCLQHPRFPMIVLNGGDRPTPRVFTLIHELAHLCLGEECICNDPFASRGREAWCNAVAASVLMPEELVRTHPRVHAVGRNHRWSDAELRSVARDFGVSREALLRRLLTLSLVTREYYQSMRKLLLAEYAGYESGGKGGPERPVVLLRNLGVGYVTRVIESLNRGAITESDASGFIFAKVRWAEAMAGLLGLPYDA